MAQENKPVERFERHGNIETFSHRNQDGTSIQLEVKNGPNGQPASLIYTFLDQHNVPTDTTQIASNGKITMKVATQDGLHKVENTIPQNLARDVMKSWEKARSDGVMQPQDLANLKTALVMAQRQSNKQENDMQAALAKSGINSHQFGSLVQVSDVSQHGPAPTQRAESPSTGQTPRR